MDKKCMNIEIMEQRIKASEYIELFLFIKAILRSTIKQQISFVLEKKAIEYGSS